MTTAMSNNFWAEKALLDLVTIRSGQVNPRAPEYRNLPLIAPDHLSSQTGRLIKLETAASQGAISGKYLVKPGDVIYSKIRPYLQKAYRCDFEALCSADMYPFTPREGVDASFVLHTILAHDFTNFATSVSARSGIPKINREELSAYRMAVPPADEQAAIGRALDEADNLIEALERLITKKRALKQGMVQQLLTGRTRLPGFSGDWITVALADIADKRDRYSLVGGPFGSSLTSAEYTATGVRILQLQNIGDGVFRGEYAIYTSERKADVLVSSNIYPGDLLLAKMGDPVARACVVPAGAPRYQMASDGIRLAVDKSAFDARLVMELINASDFRSAAEAVSTGSTRKRISLGQLRRLRITLPPDIAEQSAIAKALAAVDQQVALLRDRLSKARAIKTGMMQELLTGRTRLSVEAAG
jgi:type I restriction enzyme S subunit